MLDSVFTIPVATLLVAAISAYLQYRQFQLMSRSTPVTASHFAWLRSPAILAMTALAILAWIPSIRWMLSAPHPNIVNWGGVQFANPLTLQITVDGSSLNWYASKYRLVAVAFHYFGDKDPNDVEVQKSPTLDITDGAISLLVRPDNTFIGELTHGSINTNYHLLLVPNGVNDKAFNTIREAKALGAFDIWGAGGPP